MKRLLIAGALALAAGQALAADLSPPPLPYVPGRVPVFSWTGFYFGGDGGYGFATSSGTSANATGLFPLPYSFNVTGPIAGGFVGGNYQFGQVVVGGEADWQWADLTGNSGPLTLNSTNYTISTDVKSYGSVRARLGFAVDHLLFYGTGGWAFGSWSTSYAFTGGAPFSTDNASSYKGWTAGAGVEYAFTNWLTGRVEYRYTDLGLIAYVDVPNNSSDLGNRVTINDVRAGLAFKF